MQKTTIDKDLDVAYVQLRSGKVAKTVEFAPSMLVDFDSHGRVVGIEVLAAQEMAPELVKTKKTTRRKKSA